MSSGDLLLRLESPELRFHFELNKQLSCSLHLSNNTDNYVAFKVKTTKPKKYIVCPNTGIILPRSTWDIIITMQAQKEAPTDTQCKDKFLIQSVKTDDGVTLKDMSLDAFNKNAVVEEHRLSVVYVGNVASVPVSANSNHGDVFSNSQLGNFRSLSETSTGYLLKIEPPELRFPFELKKQISCSLQLSNKTDCYVAFKVKTNQPKKYCTRPNKGIILPRSTCQVMITMQAQREAPTDMQCKDKFLIQSIKIDDGATLTDISPEAFNKKAGRVVEECKLRVVYVAPPQRLPQVATGSEEGFLPGATTVSAKRDYGAVFSNARALIVKHIEQMRNTIQRNNTLYRYQKIKEQ